MWQGSQSLKEKSNIFTSILLNGYGPPTGLCFDTTCEKNDPIMVGVPVYDPIMVGVPVYDPIMVGVPVYDPIMVGVPVYDPITVGVPV